MIIQIDASGLREIIAELDRLQARIPLAIARGLNEGGDKVRTQVQRALREQTGLTKLKSVTSRVRTFRAYSTGLAPRSGIGPSRPASLAYTIAVQGKPSTRPAEFATRVQRGAGGGVIVAMWGVDHKFARSFQIAGDSGTIGLRARLGGPRTPLRGFLGPNLAKEAVKDKSKEAFLAGAGELVLPIIVKQLAKMLISR